jgi:two-component system, NarL family, sensor histidine kinase DesK
MAQGSGRDFEDVPDRPSPFSLYPWLLIGWGTASDAAGGKFHPAWLAAAGLAAFAGLYVAAIWARWRTARPRASYWLLAALGLVTLGLNLAFGPDMTALFPLLTIACGAVVPWLVPFKGGHGPPLPLLVVFVVAAASSLIAAQQGASAGDIWSDWYGPTLSGLIVAVLYRFMEAVAELRRTREELARSAVDAERLRFARDMHDLLGHTLSVMVVKAQVARKLASRDPAQAAQQAMDIEEIGRGALSEVRQAVAGYRGRGLARELEAARAALADAGVTVEVRQDGPPVPAGADTLLGWVVREGVTNVIRHSGGHQCQIEVHSRDGRVTVAVSDDGGGEPALTGEAAPGGGGPSGGHGLNGLRERLAAEGGTLEAGPRPGGGFCLTAAVPVLAVQGACR